MKQIKKLSLSNVVGKLTRNEMRYVMAGSGSFGFECLCNGVSLGTFYSIELCSCACHLNC